MAPEGEGKLVIDACQDCNEMRFAGLNGALCLVSSVVARWHKLKLDFLLADILLERIRRFVIQCVLFYSQSCHSHSVDYLLICPYHLLLRPVVHWFDKNIICVEVDGHHNVPVASLVCFFIPSPAILILLNIFAYALIISSFVRLCIGSTKI